MADSYPVFLRYWGSHFKSLRQAEVWAAEFQPMIARGWKCHLVLERLPEDRSWLHKFTAMGVELHCVRRPASNWDLAAVRRIRALCRRVRPQILHCDNIHLPPLAGAWLARVPVRIWHKRSMNHAFEEGRRASLKDRIGITTRLSCWLATGIIAVSNAVKDELVALRMPADKILVRHNPRRLGAARSDANRAEVRATWNFGASDVVIITVGRAAPVKGWDILVRAFRRVADVDPRARLLLVGSHGAPGEKAFTEALKGYLAEHRLKSRVTFAGYVTDLEPVLRASDLYVSPSRSEGFSYALVEALEAGLPCVTTRVGIAEDALRHGENGFLVERGDEEGLARAMLELVGNDALRRQFAARTTLPESIPTLEDYAEQLAKDREVLLGDLWHPVSG